MSFRFFKYCAPLALYAAAWVAFTAHGLCCYLPVIYAWVLVPAAELFLPADSRNMSAAEEEMARNDKAYDYLLYLFVFAQFGALLLFLHAMQEPHLSVADRIGRVYTMGLLCGSFGINIGHELGHRVDPGARLLAKLALMTSLYMHFFIEHNRGHHKHVSTYEDPGSARRGESLYRFWLRAVSQAYLNAWTIAGSDRKRRRKPQISLHNEMVRMHLVQAGFVLAIWLVYGTLPLLCFLYAALTGILLLETVNYIEHYGLSRQQLPEGSYERVRPCHSWNSNHAFGRIMLFELSRHSDHHYLASRKYQVLRHHEDAPLMPTGYPGMMLLALLPPLWFYVMHRQLDAFDAQQRSRLSHMADR